MQLVDHPSLQILPDGRGPAPDTDVLLPRRLPRLPERGLYPIGHKIEGGPPLHHDRRALVMRQDVHRRMVRRLLAPPALPILVGPPAADRPEHVAAHDPGPETFHRAPGKIVVDAGVAAA